jgi:hypothetical protein
MDKEAAEEKTCDNCEHGGDSTSEYCGSCEVGRSNWQEAGWHIQKRLQAIIDRQAEQLAAAKEASDYFHASAQNYCHNIHRLKKEFAEQLTAANANIERLREYAEHKDECEYHRGECTCGMVEAYLGEQDQKGGDSNG